MTREALAKLDFKIQALKDLREAKLLIMQETCQHPTDELLEVAYEPSMFFDARPPFRVCKLCGYAEEGWGCGYWKLNAPREEIAQISREKARRDYVLKFYYQEEITKRRRNTERLG